MADKPRHDVDEMYTTNSVHGNAKIVQITEECEHGHSRELNKRHKENRYEYECSSKVTSRSANTLFLLLRIEGIFWLALFSTLTSTVSGYREQKFAIEPQDQSAVVGSRVTLPCRVENKAGQLQWTKDDFGLGTHRHLSGYERYKMIGSDEEGDYSLDIREAVLDDDGLYQCQVSTGPRGEPAIRSRYARLIILAPPDPPRILQGSVLQAIEDRELELECVSIGGKPPAEITWVDHEGGVLTHGVTYNVEPSSDGRRFTARSKLRVRPRRTHHDQTFNCQAQNTADRAYRAATVRIEVRYAPKVRVEIHSGGVNGRISEGDTLSVGCKVDANPSDVTYKWFINNEQVVGNFTNLLVILNVTRNYNEAAIKCEAYNTVGKSSESKTLELTYGPKFLMRPQNVEMESGSTTTLSCLVEGHPQPDILWLHYEHDRIIRVGKTSNLTITVNQHSAGLYWCKASVVGFPDIEAQAVVYVKGPPKIMSNMTQYGVEGDSVRVECTSFSIPKPDYVMWSYGGREINSIHNQDYAFLEETLPEGITKSTLIIRESQFRHFGIYNCTVANIYGTDSVEIYLMPDKSFSLVLIISAGASASCFIAVVLLLIILCHRKRHKNVSTEVKKPDVTDIGKGSDQYKDSDRSSNISDLKLELRQVEGSCDVDHSNAGSETEFNSNIHLTSNMGLGLPLAGPVSLSTSGYDNELMKQYQRYSSDFNDPTNNLHFKVHNQSNGYVPYVDYSRDYVPPILNSNDSLTGSLSRSIDTASTVQCNAGLSQNSLQRLQRRQESCNGISNLSTAIGPDVIPMSNSGILMGGRLDAKYAAMYGNPYVLRSNGPVSYTAQVNTANPSSTPAPPPYYAIRNSNLAQVPSLISPSSSTSTRPVTSPMASSSSTNSGAQPQAPKISPQGVALYTVPAHSRCSIQGTQITTKGNGNMASNGTHV